MNDWNDMEPMDPALDSANTGVEPGKLRWPTSVSDLHRLTTCAVDSCNCYISQNPLCAFHLLTRHFNSMAALGLKHTFLYLIYSDIQYIYV